MSEHKLREQHRPKCAHCKALRGIRNLGRRADRDALLNRWDLGDQTEEQIRNRIARMAEWSHPR